MPRELAHSRGRGVTLSVRLACGASFIQYHFVTKHSSLCVRHLQSERDGGGRFVGMGVSLMLTIRLFGYGRTERSDNR